MKCSIRPPLPFGISMPARIRQSVEWSIAISTRKTYLSHLTAMLYLHRSFFAQTMLDHPDNPLMSPFAPSFLAACRSASIIVRAAGNLFRRCSPMATRVWFLMYHMLSAAVRRNHPCLRCTGNNDFIGYLGYRRDPLAYLKFCADGNARLQCRI